MATEPDWLTHAGQDLGKRETLGPNDAPWLRAMWASLSGSWLLGQPWCGGAVAHWMAQSGIQYPKHYYRAKAWLDWGSTLTAPLVGAVVVFDRKGGGHVGLIVGKDTRGRLMVLGGNQGDAVSIAPFDMARVLGYRWPIERLAMLPTGGLPIVASAGESSMNEA